MDSVLFAVCLAALVSTTVQQELVANFHMNGVTGQARFAWRNPRNLDISIQLSETWNGITLEIRSFWVNYGVEDKCSESHLGEIQFTSGGTFSAGNADIAIPGVANLNLVKGLSVLLRSASGVVCGTIERPGDHRTAVAHFHGRILGTVYFRQFNSSESNEPTRIVTDLYSSEDFHDRMWKITNTFESCASLGQMSLADIYGSEIFHEKSCHNTTNQMCDMGDLSGKHSSVPIASNRGEARKGYTDENLALTSWHNNHGNLLLMYPRDLRSSPACAEIRILHKRGAMAYFSHDGVTGTIRFSQNSPFDPTETVVNLQGLRNSAKGYHVHLWPTAPKTLLRQSVCSGYEVSGHFNPYNVDVNSPRYPSPASSTGDKYELGDLSSKYGTFKGNETASFTKLDYNLPLYGSNSIVGRSLVIHRDDAGNSRWVCANIEPLYPVVFAIASLKYPVIGHIIFMQEKNQPMSETTIFAQLDYNDGRAATENHQWAINTNHIRGDMLQDDEMERCKSTGAVYNPMALWQDISDRLYSSFCTINKPFGCKIGDLSAKLEPLNIRHSGSGGTVRKQFFTSMNIPLSGPFSIIGKPLVIMNEDGRNILSCAHIQRLHDTTLVAHFTADQVSGMVTFHQPAAFGATNTSVMNKLTGMENYRLNIHTLPPQNGDNSCSETGPVFNPMNMTSPPTPLTDDEYQVGDLSRHGTVTDWSSYNLPLTGLDSIKGRSLIVVDSNAQVKACAKIDIYLSDSVSQHVMATSTFTGDINGTVQLSQTLYADGTTSDTTILVNLAFQNGTKSPKHNWHTHKTPIQNDSQADDKRCSSAGPHFDPYKTINMNNSDNYKMECSPANPLRCEVGDQARKLEPYDVGSGRVLFTDVDLPLSGTYSVQGRSMVLHVHDMGAPRLACADIIPVTDDPIAVTFSSPASLNKREVAQTYASAIRANPEDIVVELISESDKKTTVHVHFLGLQRTAMRERFAKVTGDEDYYHNLAPYDPVVSDGYFPVVSTVLFLVAMALHLTVYF